MINFDSEEENVDSFRFTPLMGTQWQGVGDYMILIMWLYIKWALVTILYFAFVGVDTPRDPLEEKPHFTYILVGPIIAFLHFSSIREVWLDIVEWESETIHYQNLET